MTTANSVAELERMPLGELFDLYDGVLEEMERTTDRGAVTEDKGERAQGADYAGGED